MTMNKELIELRAFLVKRAYDCRKLAERSNSNDQF